MVFSGTGTRVCQTSSPRWSGIDALGLGLWGVQYSQGRVRGRENVQSKAIPIKAPFLPRKKARKLKFVFLVSSLIHSLVKMDVGARIF